MSRVQFNLLPDVKLNYIKTEKTRNMVVTTSIIVSAVAFGIFVILLFTVNVVQKKQLSDSTAAAISASKKLQEIDKLEQALTIQNQMNTLAGLHEKKRVTSRLFTYLPQVTPTSVNISSLSIDFTNNTMTVSGTANSHASVNQFIDTLKFTTYKLGGEDSKPAFPSVIESSFGITAANVSYGLNVTFDPKLFANDVVDEKGNVQVPKLSVPNITTTRSILEISNNPLFKARVAQPPAQPTSGAPQ